MANKDVGLASITRKVEFDAGHRIPDHKSKCRNVHGHRYVLEATVTGPIRRTPGESDDGMVVDFGDLKQILTTNIADIWDHAFLCYSGDADLINAISLALGEDHRTVILDVVPTVENLAAKAFAILAPIIAVTSGDCFKLARVRMYETPNCWADATDQTVKV